MARQFALIIVSIALAVSAAGCMRRVPLRQSLSVATTVPADEAQIRAAIARALGQRHWALVGEQYRQIRARLAHRNRVIELQIDYHPAGYAISYVGSEGLGASQRRGQLVISAYYDRYVERLRRSIDQEIRRPYIEAQRAAEIARRQQVAVTAYPAYAVTVSAQAPSGGPPALAYPSCEQTLQLTGHAPAAAVHCRGAEPYCADALLRMGHAPAALVHCRGVDPTCAQNRLLAGDYPASLVHCR